MLRLWAWWVATRQRQLQDWFTGVALLAVVVPMASSHGFCVALLGPVYGRPPSLVCIALMEQGNIRLIFSYVGPQLGEMPDQGDLCQLNLPVTSGTEAVEGVAPQLVSGGKGESTPSNASGSGGAKKPVEKPVEKPFILSEGLPPVPYKLVTRIFRGEYVDMAELL